MKEKQKTIEELIEDLIQQDEVKEMLGVKPGTSNTNRTINRLIRQGKIRAFQPHGKIKTVQPGIGNQLH